MLQSARRCIVGAWKKSMTAYKISSSRRRSNSSSKEEMIDMINLRFAEAREEIEMAMESKDTVYFDEEAECARIAVNQVLDSFNSLLDSVPHDQRASILNSMGLKIQQLKSEAQQLD